MNKRKICSDVLGSSEGETMSSTDYEAPFHRKFPDLLGEEPIPNLENDFTRAKAYLMRQCLSSGDNLWDHLNEVLRKILVERPKNIGCTFEEFSYRVKEAKFKPKTDHLLDVFVPEKHYALSEKLLHLFQVADEKTDADKTEGDEEIKNIEPDLMEMFYYFEQGGVGLPREEVFCIALHLKKLLTEHPVERYRFWGKILGIKRNYYVAETELKEEEIIRLAAEVEEENEKIRLEKKEKEIAEREEMKAAMEKDLLEAKEREVEFAVQRSILKQEELIKIAKAHGLTDTPSREELPPWPPLPPIPKPIPKPIVEIPPEPIGTGVNKKVFFVCHHPGDPWIRLPDVTPQQIVIARNIRRAFTGDLESDMATYPEFPGKEKNFLRAQIARISAGTQISPLGFYTFNEDYEEEEEEEAGMEGGKTNYAINPDFEPVGLRDLIDPSMAFWVHHTQYILGQGRTTWWNPKPKDEDEEEGEEEEEEVPPEKEAGPELLTPLSEDSALDSSFPWSVRKTSNLFPNNAVAIVRSNLWPGAYAFAIDKKFDNIYFGNGLKLLGQNHSPVPLSEIQDEYPTGPEIMEITDPTPEQEDAWRWAHEKKAEEEEEPEPDDDADPDADDEDE